MKFKGQYNLPPLSRDELRASASSTATRKHNASNDAAGVYSSSDQRQPPTEMPKSLAHCKDTAKNSRSNGKEETAGQDSSHVAQRTSRQTESAAVHDVAHKMPSKQCHRWWISGDDRILGVDFKPRIRAPTDFVHIDFPHTMHTICPAGLCNACLFLWANGVKIQCDKAVTPKDSKCSICREYGFPCNMQTG